MKEFWTAALPWILLGIVLAVAVAAITRKK